MTQNPNVEIQQACQSYVDRYREISDRPIQQPAELRVGTLEYGTSTGREFKIKVVHDSAFANRIEWIDRAITTTFELGVERDRPLVGPLAQGSDVILNVFRIQHTAGDTNKSSCASNGETAQGYWGMLLIHPHDDSDVTLFHEVTHFAERMFFISDSEHQATNQLIQAGMLATTPPEISESHPFVRGDLSFDTWLREHYNQYLDLSWESWVIDAFQAGFPHRGTKARNRQQAAMISHNILESYAGELMGVVSTCERMDPADCSVYITRRDALRRIQQVYHKHVHPSDLGFVKHMLFKQHVRV